MSNNKVRISLPKPLSLQNLVVTSGPNIVPTPLLLGLRPFCEKIIENVTQSWVTVTDPKDEVFLTRLLLLRYAFKNRQIEVKRYEKKRSFSPKRKLNTKTTFQLFILQILN